MKHLPNTGTVIKKSRAYYVTIPQGIFRDMSLKVGDKVEVTYNTHYDEIIIRKEGAADGRIPFRYQGT